MQVHEIYAHAFYQLMVDDPVHYYREFRTIARILHAVPQITSTLMFNPNRIEEIADLLFFEVSEIVKRMIYILLEDGMLDQIDQIQQSMRNLLVDDGFWITCIIETSEPMSKGYYEKIKTKVDVIYHGEIEYEIQVNPFLKSGIRLFINDTVLDFSLGGRFQKLVEEVSNG
ncbi:hypothetical protein AOC36_06955 [Erysipelothrix larvae]|uniref:Uncharacterized protein n=1 Tax=Erysipelothrix larvae TaxID=1514105 RepID=A0A0X8H0A4_9FIRM|nr:F0F1 ATP synthase subunit delta [Erysipelothrix larvae]AMC93730.1 hypothetical protein AOC36_06955 [Erysipelothrix larvae]